jgi:hypothetical protein
MINLLQEKLKGKPPHKLHIWFFADTQKANPKKPKEQFLANAKRRN